MTSKTVGRVIAALAMVLWLAPACETSSPTHPNVSIINQQYKPPAAKPGDNLTQARVILFELSKRNRLLALELGKLPEMRDGVSAQELKALKNIQDFYNANQAAFDSAFAKMYKVGKPEVRKYCSPLQAVFWLAEEKEFTAKSNPIAAYQLDYLLNKAWVFSLQLSKKEMEQIINGISDSEIKTEYLKMMNQGNSHSFVRFINVDYKRNPGIFSEDSRDVLEKIYGGRNTRWSDFNSVVNRLNAPELIDIYERDQFSYFYGCCGELGIIEYSLANCSPECAFKDLGGNCGAHTSFTSYCLIRGGYEAYNMRVWGHAWGYHWATLYKIGNKWYVMDNGRGGIKRGILGPFDSVNDVPYHVYATHKP